MKKCMIRYKAKCPICNNISAIKIDKHKFMLYNSGFGKIQDLFPDLSENERELILTGICNTCWNALFDAIDSINIVEAEARLVELEK